MKLIPLTKGLFARVDDEDYLRVMQFTWRAVKDGNTWYARAKNRGGRQSYMHAFIMNTPKGKETHHWDRNGLNNEKNNLQIVSRAEHARIDRCQFRRTLGKNSSTGLLGVGKRWANGTWPAHIKQDGHTFRLGTYASREEAGRARDAKARELGWPEDGMNFPNDSRPPPWPVVLCATNKTGARGVSLRNGGIYHARVRHNNVEHHVGYFRTCQEAALARDRKSAGARTPRNKNEFSQTMSTRLQKDKKMRSGDRSFQSGVNGKGDADRTDDIESYRRNFDAINWGRAKTTPTKKTLDSGA